MEFQGYGEQIIQTVQTIPYGTAIFQEDIARILAENFVIPLEQAKKITNVNMKRLADKREIERLQKGIYYRAKQTVFGKTKPNIDAVMTRLLTEQGGEVIGYETSNCFRNKIGLITLLPKNKEIATNGYRKQIDARSHVIPKKPITKVNRNNYRYLQILDTIDDLPKVYVDAENPNKVVKTYIEREQLDKVKLIYTARMYYPTKTVLRVIDIMAEEEYELTH